MQVSRHPHPACYKLFCSVPLPSYIDTLPSYIDTLPPFIASTCTYILFGFITIPHAFGLEALLLRAFAILYLYSASVYSKLMKYLFTELIPIQRTVLAGNIALFLCQPILILCLRM